jgi:hypothetical protein
MKNRNTHWFVRIILCSMFLLTVFSFVPNIAHAKAAITCYKDGCDDTDPVMTGCGTSPSTVTTMINVYLGSGSNTEGLLEIRLSHARPYGCNTVWERLTAYIPGLQVCGGLFSNRAQLFSGITINPFSQYTQVWGNQFGRDGSFIATIGLGAEDGCAAKSIEFS